MPRFLAGCKYKERYENIVSLNKNQINSIKVIYPNLNKDTKVIVYINQKEFTGILKIQDSIIDLKDYGGLMLSKLNNIDLEVSICPYCFMKHTDNGKFAYTKHSTHLCIYCGHFYKVEKENIGNELALYFNVPNVVLPNKTEYVDENLELEYDILEGNLKVNGNFCNKLIINNKEVDLVDYLNEVLKEEY